MSNYRIEFVPMSIYANGKIYRGEELKAYLKQQEEEEKRRDAITIRPKFPNFKKTLISREYGVHKYSVSSTEGMTEADIINQCDPNNFGGRVCGSTVEVYID